MTSSLLRLLNVYDFDLRKGRILRRNPSLLKQWRKNLDGELRPVAKERKMFENRSCSKQTASSRIPGVAEF